VSHGEERERNQGQREKGRSKDEKGEVIERGRRTSTVLKGMSRGGGQKQSEEYESMRVSVDETVRYVERER